jgi:hypothetical protein
MSLSREQIQEAVETAAFGGPLEDPDIPAFDLIPMNFFGMCELYPDERELWDPEDFELLIDVLEEMFNRSLQQEISDAREELAPGVSVLVTASLSDELLLYIRDNADYPDGKSLLLALGKPGQEAKVG